MRPALLAEEVRKAIEHRKPMRVPMMIHMWNWAGAFEDRADEVRAIQAEYPNDMPGSVHLRELGERHQAAPSRRSGGSFFQAAFW